MKTSMGVLAFVSTVGSAAMAGMPDSAALDKFDRTGEKVSCISARATDITPVNESTLLVRAGGDYYVNDLRNQCNGIDDRFTRIELKLFTGQLCNGEIVKVVQQSGGAFRGSCSLGDFELLKRKSSADQ